MGWAAGSVFEEVGGGVREGRADLTLPNNSQAPRADVGSRPSLGSVGSPTCLQVLVSGSLELLTPSVALTFSPGAERSRPASSTLRGQGGGVVIQSLSSV